MAISEIANEVQLSDSAVKQMRRGNYPHVLNVGTVYHFARISGISMEELCEQEITLARFRACYATRSHPKHGESAPSQR